MLFYCQVLGRLGVALALLGVILVLGKEGAQNLGKTSPFECGFLPLASARVAFSIQFFLVALVFLVFDVEVVLLYPVSYEHKSLFFLGVGTYLLFIIMLILGLCWEWSQGRLEWLK